jgi:putative transcriptional regulator
MTNLEFSNSLENHFLIAMPQLTDAYFANSVTYLWKHGPEGALGIVINKPTRASVADIFDELNIVCSVDSAIFKKRRVLAGGPVERDKGFIIHDSSLAWESSITVSSTLSICTSRQILQDIAAGKGPDHYLLALGCAGWDAGQLEREIGENAWLTVPAKDELIFSQDFATKSASAAAILGIDLNQLSPEAGHS